MIDIEYLIGQLAFPAIVCLWFMFRTEKFISANTEATQKLNLTLEKLFFQQEKEK